MYNVYLILVGIELRWIGYNNGIVGQNTFVVSVHVNYLAYIETYFKV
jgi:hypothetical protein